MSLSQPVAERPVSMNRLTAISSVDLSLSIIALGYLSPRYPDNHIDHLDCCDVVETSEHWNKVHSNGFVQRHICKLTPGQRGGTSHHFRRNYGHRYVRHLFPSPPLFFKKAEAPPPSVLTRPPETLLPEPIVPAPVAATPPLLR